MYPFRGKISGTVDSVSQDLPMLIEGFTLANMTGGTIGCNVYMLFNSQLVAVAPNNLQLATAEMYEATNKIVMRPTEQIRLVTTGMVDYDFAISNLKPDEV